MKTFIPTVEITIMTPLTNSSDEAYLQIETTDGGEWICEGAFTIDGKGIYGKFEKVK